jgi:ABC-type phosphate transport system substrate-binding protein
MKQLLLSMTSTVILSVIALPAAAELVLVVNPQNPATKMYASQAAQFFLGGSVQFTPVEQAENSAIRAEFYKKVLEREPGQVQAIWSKIIFSGKGKPPKECKSSAEVKKIISENVNAIGYIEKSAVDDSVKVIATIP